MPSRTKPKPYTDDDAAADEKLLADQRRQAIERLRAHGTSVARIADRMGVSTAAVHATLRRGK